MGTSGADLLQHSQSTHPGGDREKAGVLACRWRDSRFLTKTILMQTRPRMCVLSSMNSYFVVSSTRGMREDISIEPQKPNLFLRLKPNSH